MPQIVMRISGEIDLWIGFVSKSVICGGCIETPFLSPVVRVVGGGAGAIYLILGYPTPHTWVMIRGPGV